MGEPRRCRKCGEGIPEGRHPSAEDCGLPKCKSKAYRKQKKEEAEALAAALVAALAAKDESPPEASAASPTSETEPVRSPKVSTPSCAAAPLLGRGQEVRLQPGQQTIILVCGCGARTTLQISHTESVSDPAQVALPVAPHARSEVSLPVANLAVSEAGEREASAVVPVEPKVAAQESTGQEPAVANPLSVPATAPVSPGAEEAISKSTHVEGAESVAKASEPPVATTPVAITSPQPATQVATAAADRATPQQSTAPEAAPTWDDDLPDPIPFTVYEMYAYRGSRHDEPVLIDDAMTRLGTLHPDYHVTFTSNPEQGFKLCAPTGLHRILWGIAHKLNRCQLPKKLIVYGKRGPSDGLVLSHNVSVKTIESLLGRHWKWMVGQ